METAEEDKSMNMISVNIGSADDPKPLSDRNGKQGSKIDLKLCGVCGDKALGNNFNAITCESCKAFFRRNALRTKDFNCPFSNNCKVDPVTRRFCQKCRLKKCFEIGMKKEWIMTDEEKQLKKNKIEQNRMKRASSDNHSDSLDAICPQKLSALSPVTTFSTDTKEPLSLVLEQQQSNLIHVEDPSKSPVGAIPIHQIRAVAVLPVNEAYVPLTPIVQSPVTVLTHPVTNAVEKRVLINTSIPPPNPTTCIPQTFVWPPNPHNTRTITNASTHHMSPEGTFFPVNQGGNVLQNGTPTMPLLASLIRPGMADSPPHPVDPPPTIIIEGVTTSRTDDLPNLRGEGSLEDEDASCHSMGNSSSSSGASSGGDLFSTTEPPLPWNTMDSIVSVAISAEFNAFGVLGHCRESLLQSSNSKELNKAERAKLNELFLASQALNAPVDADGPINIETWDPSLINVINLTDIAIRRLIKMSKKIGAFQSMCQEDQIALLKGGCTEMMILRSVVSYDPERDSWNIPHSNGYNINLGVLKEARGNLYEEHQRFVRSFKSDWRSDDNIMILLCAITLFTPQRPNVIHKDVVKLEQDSYYYILKRYLESTRNGCEAKSTYLQLIKKIAELHVLNSNHLRVFLEVNPREVEPLLIEIFDLKQ